MRRTARRRPLVRPVGYYTTDRCARRAERYSRSFERLVRVPYATACGSSTTIMKHGNTRVESSSAARSFRPGETGVYALAPRNERTNERADDRSSSSSRSTFAPTNNFFFKYKIRTALYIRTQHCHGSVSRDRMAHMWRAHSVGRAILPRFLDERDRTDRRAYRTSTPRTRVAEGDPRGLSSRILVLLSEILSRPVRHDAPADTFLDVLASHRRSSVRAKRLRAATMGE